MNAMSDWTLGRATARHAVSSLRAKTTRPILRAHLAALAKRQHCVARGAPSQTELAADLLQARRSETKR
jgi:hypothetical protein